MNKKFKRSSALKRPTVTTLIMTVHTIPPSDLSPLRARTILPPTVTLPTERVTPAPKGARKQKIKMSPRCETSSIPFIRELEPRLGVTSRRDFFLILPRHALATFMLRFKFTLPRSEGRYFGSLSIREMLFAGKLLNSSRHAPGSQYL